MARPGFFLQFALLDDHPHLGDAELAAWVRLSAASARAMNGGRHAGAARWDLMAWARIAGCKRRAIDSLVAAGAARWEGDDLVLAHYDTQGEEVWKRCSNGGAEGNRRRWEANRNAKDTANRGATSGGDRGATTPPTEDATGIPDPHSTALHSTEENHHGAPSPGDTPRKPAITTTRKAPGGGGAKPKIISALDPHAVVEATRSDLRAVLDAFKVNTDGRRMDEWLRDADGLTPSQVAVILFDAWRRQPIREPSGFRPLVQAWIEMPAKRRSAMTDALRAWAAPALEAAG